MFIAALWSAAGFVLGCLAVLFFSAFFSAFFSGRQRASKARAPRASAFGDEAGDETGDGRAREEIVAAQRAIAGRALMQCAPFGMLWCVVDARKKIIARAAALAPYADASAMPYFISVFKSAALEDCVDRALMTQEQQRAQGMLLFDARWDAHVIPLTLETLEGMRLEFDEARPRDFSDAPQHEKVALIACIPAAHQTDMSETAQDEFLQNVAHELKNPLTAVIGFAELLHKDANNKEVVERMQRQGRRLFEILDTMALLTRSGGATEDEKNFTPVALDACVQAAAEELKAQAHGRRVDIQFKMPRSSSVVYGNEALLRVVFKNIVENAVKHSPVGGRVTVSIKTAAGLEKLDKSEKAGDSKKLRHATVVVKDQGAGVPREYAEKVFQRFYRLDVGRSRAQGGTGLGLAITKKIVAMHKGAVWVVPGNESAFAVRLPLHHAPNLSLGARGPAKKSAKKSAEKPAKKSENKPIKKTTKKLISKTAPKPTKKLSSTSAARKKP